MYYHEFISQIAKALRKKDFDAIVDTRRIASNHLLSNDEMSAIDAIVDAIIETVEE